MQISERGTIHFIYIIRRNFPIQLLLHTISSRPLSSSSGLASWAFHIPPFLHIAPPTPPIPPFTFSPFPRVVLLVPPSHRRIVKGRNFCSNICKAALRGIWAPLKLHTNSWRSARTVSARARTTLSPKFSAGWDTVGTYVCTCIRISTWYSS